MLIFDNWGPNLLKLPVKSPRCQSLVTRGDFEQNLLNLARSVLPGLRNVPNHH